MIVQPYNQIYCINIFFLFFSTTLHFKEVILISGVFHILYVEDVLFEAFGKVVCLIDWVNVTLLEICGFTQRRSQQLEGYLSKYYLRKVHMSVTLSSSL